MSRYQKHYGNATSHMVNIGIPTWAATLTLVLVWLFAPPFCAGVAAQSAPASASPSPIFVLIPAEAAKVNLHTHTADFQLTEENGALTLSLDALYRLKNTDKTPVNLTLKVADASNQLVTTLPPLLGLTINDEPAPLLFSENVGYTTQIPIAADTLVDLHLRYSQVLTETPITTVRYDVAALRTWAGQPSLRVSIALPPTLVGESWLRVEPAEWNLGQTEASQQPRLKWLYDAELPDQPFVFQFIQPEIWRQIQEAQAAAVNGAASSNFIALGERYHQLYQATDGALRARFYAQTLAAYTAGIRNAATINAPITDQAPLHAGLATLYRDRVSNSTGVIDQRYASLMATETALALAGLPPNAPQRKELLQWQVEGLTLQLNTAREQHDWTSAFHVLDQLANLPSESLDPAKLTETRRALTVQQALQLLEEGNQAAALALAGQDIRTNELLPPANAQALFRTWQVTMTVQPAQSVLEFVGTPNQERNQDAQQALRTLIDSWQAGGLPQGFAVALDEQPATNLPTPGLHLMLTVPSFSNGAPLAKALPSGADWALLRALLSQLSPQVEQSVGLFRQVVQITQPLELRGAGEEWLALAATLEKAAAEFDAQSPTINLAERDPASAEQALRTHIQAANYRQAAQVWRDLARTTLVRATLSASTGLQTTKRSWLATVETPTQPLVLQASGLSLGRLLSTAGLALVGLFLLTGTLWWLLS
jgi:hypothetical protein